MSDNPDSLNKAVDSLSEQKKKLDIALYYTHNDTEKSKNMVAGAYKDLYAIKGKFSVSNTYGAFLLFFNMPYCSLTNSYVLVSHSYLLDDLKTISKWRIFEEEMQNMSMQNGTDNEMTARMKTEFSQAFTIQMAANQRANELKKFLEANDEIAANRVIQKFIHDKFGFININLSVDYEQISSLEMELNSKSIIKIEQSLLSQTKENKSENAEADNKTEEDEDLDKKDIQLILTGNLVLSPIKGKSISSVEIGDRIKVNLDASNPKAVTVARAFKVYEEGKMSPITGRVVSIKRRVEGGFKVFCIIAKGIYVKIEEEEENIRIATEDVTTEENTAADSHMPIFIALIIIFIVLVALALFLVLK